MLSEKCALLVESLYHGGLHINDVLVVDYDGAVVVIVFVCDVVVGLMRVDAVAIEFELLFLPPIILVGILRLILLHEELVVQCVLLQFHLVKSQITPTFVIYLSILFRNHCFYILVPNKQINSATVDDMQVINYRRSANDKLSVIN